MLTGFDYAVMIVIGLSALRGMWRGLLAEIFALAGYVIAFLVARHYVGEVAGWIPSTWPGGEMTQLLLAFALLFIATMLVIGVLAALANRMTEATGLRAVDRSLGMVFGLARGVLLVLLMVALAGLTTLPQQDFWRNGLLRPYAEQGVRGLKPLLPDTLAAYVHY
ncbi:CvpA family protein [Pararobbsia silviterrae]|uniref:CvpA family protein n=1 Tax=Pararobbsia silviterrae TaxID=1792498 RepID=A0A494YA51_9BURK|nr:CvpA family protein [Pararobbsia silviterrae]RKP57505.1 CvpA family protein [Pararobbsia silviterrae]